MSRTLAAAAGALLLFSGIMQADDAQTVQEVRELKQLMEQQMKRIDELTVEVGRLHQAVEAQRAAMTGAPAPKRDAAGPPPFSGLTEMKVERLGTEGAIKGEAIRTETSALAEPPKAEAVNGIRHTVAKGETLTSIAKHYNIGLPELQKANKEVNDRKLQIGQTVTIPATKPPEPTPSDKKNNL